MNKSRLSALTAAAIVFSNLSASGLDDPANHVSWFAQSAYADLNTLSTETLDDHLAEARQWFSSRTAYDGYVEAFKSSGNYQVIEQKHYTLTPVVDIASAQAADKGNGVWEVHFPAQLTYSGDIEQKQCLSVTMSLKYDEGAVGIVDVLAEPSGCLA